MLLHLRITLSLFWLFISQVMTQPVIEKNNLESISKVYQDWRLSNLLNEPPNTPSQLVQILKHSLDPAWKADYELLRFILTGNYYQIFKWFPEVLKQLSFDRDGVISLERLIKYKHFLFSKSASYPSDLHRVKPTPYMITLPQLDVIIGEIFEDTKLTNDAGKVWIDFLLSTHVSSDFPGLEGPFEWACKVGHLNHVKQIIERNLAKTPGFWSRGFLEAIKSGNKDIVDLLTQDQILDDYMVEEKMIYLAAVEATLKQNFEVSTLLNSKTSYNSLYFWSPGSSLPITEESIVSHARTLGTRTPFILAQILEFAVIFNRQDLFEKISSLANVQELRLLHGQFMLQLVDKAVTFHTGIIDVLLTKTKPLLQHNIRSSVTAKLHQSFKRALMDPSGLSWAQKLWGFCMDLEVPVSHIVANLAPHAAPLRWFLTQGLFPNLIQDHVELAFKNGEWLFVEELIKGSTLMNSDLLSMTQRLLERELLKSAHSSLNLVLIDGLIPFVQNLRLESDLAQQEILLKLLLQTQKTRNGIVFRRLWYHILNTTKKRQIFAILQKLKTESVDSFFEKQIDIAHDLREKMTSMDLLAHWESAEMTHIAVKHL